MTVDHKVILKAVEDEIRRRKKEEALRYWNQIPGRRHKKQAEAMACFSRYLGIFGGNRSGKTVFGAVRTTLFLLGKSAEPYIQDWCEEDQQWWYKNFSDLGAIEAWHGTVNWDIQRDITQPELLKWIPKPELDKSIVAYRRKGVIDYIVLPNGSRITFKSYDSGREAFQGKSLYYLWLDEECEKHIWDEAKQRLMDQKGHVCLTMTPLKGLTWAYNEIYVNDIGDPEVRAFHFTWDDNPWLDEGEKNRMLRGMSEDEIAARKFGEFLAGGESVLSKKNLMTRQREAPDPILRMKWTEDKRFVPDPEGELLIWEKPVKGRFYIIGADVAEGLPSGDNSVASVIDATSANQVAELTVKVDTTTFGDMLVWLGQWYNTALIAPERNNNGHAVIQHLDREALYPAIYKHTDDRYGWQQNSQTRPIVVSYMQDFVRDAVHTINSKDLIQEGLTFIRNERGRPEAAGKGRPGGNKDDRLFAWGIALAVRDKYGPPLSPVKPKLPDRKRPDAVNNPWADEDKDEDLQNDRYARWDPNAFVTFNY